VQGADLSNRGLIGRNIWFFIKDKDSGIHRLNLQQPRNSCGDRARFFAWRNVNESTDDMTARESAISIVCAPGAEVSGFTIGHSDDGGHDETALRVGLPSFNY